MGKAAGQASKSGPMQSRKTAAKTSPLKGKHVSEGTRDCIENGREPLLSTAGNRTDTNKDRNERYLLPYHVV